MQYDWTEGTAVRIVTPDNERLDGQLASVLHLMPWGAILTTSVGSGEFRALWEEMVPLPKTNGTHSGKRDTVTNYTGDPCSYCGSMNVVRAGTCGHCLDCNNSTGCG